MKISKVLWFGLFLFVFKLDSKDIKDLSSAEATALGQDVQTCNDGVIVDLIAKATLAEDAKVHNVALKDITPASDIKDGTKEEVENIVKLINAMKIGGGAGEVAPEVAEYQKYANVISAVAKAKAALVKIDASNVADLKGKITPINFAAFKAVIDALKTL